jgi:hypothetical protein
MILLMMNAQPASTPSSGRATARGAERPCRVPPRSLYISYHSCLVRFSSLN